MKKSPTAVAEIQDGMFHKNHCEKLEKLRIDRVKTI